MKFLPLLLLALCGCQTHTLSDGTKIRTDHFAGFATPSVTVVSVRPAGTTNWNAPVVLTGPGLVSAAASGVAVVVPVGRDGSGNSVSVSSSATGGSATGGNASSTSAATGKVRPPANRPPNHPHNKGR